MAADREAFTIGHSTHPIERFLKLLGAHRIAAVADVRRYPGSRRHPQFGAEALASSLGEQGIAYVALGDKLGGRRRARPGSANAGWRSASFRGYADHMASDPFAAGLARLAALASERRTAIMCAEGDWRRCHRQLIADALAARGWRVVHILPDGRSEAHQPTPFAEIRDGQVSYPAEESLLG
jgi:uncharacterized protein (DUF488 family)